MNYSLKIVRDIDSCERLWNDFSPKNSIFDLWTFRKAWVEGFKYSLEFYELKKDDIAVGLLPLWFNTKSKQYEWVGGEWPEDNTFFVKNNTDLTFLLKNAPKPLSICALLPFEEIQNLSAVGTIEKDSFLKYVKDVSQYKSFEELLNSFEKKNRQKLVKDYEHILEYNPQIALINTNDPKYFDLFISLKNLRFNDGVENSNFFDNKEHIRTFKQIIKNGGEYQVRILSIHIQKKLAGIDMILIYKGKYYLIGGSYDTARFSGVGNAALYLLFRDALQLKCTLIDCLQEDNGWKHRYFDGKQLYFFEK